MPNRKIEANLFGVFWVAENAAIGAANAIPVRTAAGIARTISGDSAAPNSTMTSVKIEQMSVSRAAIQARLPRAMSRGVIGVAYIAWKTLLQIEPAHDREHRLERRRLHRGRGQQPGREEDEVRHAADARRRPRRTPPSPMPIAVRNMTGDRNDEKIDARNVRR